MVIMDTSEDNSEKINLKPLKCQLNYLSKSDGSAILSQGETVALASVNGPINIKQSKQLMDKANLEVMFLTKSGPQMVNYKYKENIIKQTCEGAILLHNFPRTGIHVTIQEVEDFGGLLSCCLNAACLALLNSGVPLNHTFAAVNCMVNDSGNIIVDPSLEDQKKSIASMTFTFDCQNKNLLSCVSEGKFSKGTYLEALYKCRAASDVVFDFYKDIVTQYSKIIL